MVTRVEITYHLDGDPEGTERKLVATHDGKGQAIDAVIWSNALMEKLAYNEQGRCRTPNKGPGRDGWKVRDRKDGTAEVEKSAATGEMLALNGGTDECVWFHTHSCDWQEYCAPT